MKGEDSNSGQKLLSFPLKMLDHIKEILAENRKHHLAYPPELFHMRIKEEMLRSQRSDQPFLYLEIATRHYDLFGFAKRSSNAITAWKIAVLTIMTEVRFYDIIGFLENDAGVGVILLDTHHDKVQYFKKQILRNMREAGLLEKVRLRPRRPFFKAHYFSGQVEKNHQKEVEKMSSFSHINEGFFTIEPFNYSQLVNNRWNNIFINFFKRCLDFSGALFGILLLSPILFGLYLLVRLTSPGPALFRQIRVGKDGHHFTMLKFRSMYIDAEERLKELKNENEADGPIFKIKNDPRITPPGRFIRKYSLDELPQLFNVLRGDMAIVGPRPPLPVEVLEYLPWHKMRLSVKPGLTCHWQVSGRSNISFQEWMRLDNKYVRHGNLKTDIALIGKTFKAVIKGDGAY